MGSYSVDRGRDLSGPTELRIHGVGGALPESLIEAEAVLVAGDETSGFYRAKHILRRRRGSPGHEHRTQADNRMAIREAYTWGGLTSGGGFLARLKKSVWVVLLPYSLLNSAGWMAPPVGDQRADRYDRDDQHHPGSGGTRNRVIRLLGVWMTMVFALWLAAIFIDMAALQCGSNPDCAGGHSWLKWLNWDWLRFFQGRPVGLMTVGLIAPLLGLGLLWRIGVVSQRASEGRLFALTATDDAEQSLSDEAGTDGPKDRAAKKLEAKEQRKLEKTENSNLKKITGEGMTRTELARDDLWHAKHRVGSLLRVHLAVAVSAVAAVFAFTVAWLEHASGDANGLLMILSLGALTFSVGVALWGAVPGGTRPRLVTWRLLGASMGILITVVVVSWVAAQEFAELRPLIGGRPTLIGIRNQFNGAALVVGLAPIILFLVVLFLLVWRAEYDKENPTRTRFGQWIAAALGVIAGAPVIIGGALWLGDLLDRFSASQERCDQCAVVYDIDIPGFYGAGGAALVIIGLVLILLVVRYYMTLWKLRKKRDGLKKLSDEIWSQMEACGTQEEAKKRFPEELGGLTNDQMRELWEAHEEFKAWSTSLVGTRLAVEWGRNRGVRTGFILVAVTMLFALWAVGDIVATALGGNLKFQEWLTKWSWLVALGKWAVLALFGLVLTLAYKSYRSDDTRRSVARAWDVLTFWPRWFHPLAPPSYAASALPQLRTHLRRRHRLEFAPKPGEENSVLISAHSQGTVLAVAAVARLDAQTRSRLALLTYGSPVRSLYGWFFPRFFDRREMEEVAKSLGGPSEAKPEDPPERRYARWRNLRRCTDPIAGTIFTDGDDRGNENCLGLAAEHDTQADGSIRLNKVDWIVPDPYPAFSASGDPMPATRGHSNYDLDAPFESARCELFEALGADLVEVGCEPEPSP